MTFAEWMNLNGYSEYNSAAGRKELQRRYGITNSNAAEANMELWNKLKSEKAQMLGQIPISTQNNNDQRLKAYYALDNVIKYFTNREASRTQEYQNRLEEALKYLPEDVASKVRYMNNMGTSEDEQRMLQRRLRAAINQLLYEYATQAKSGLFSSTQNGTGPAQYSRERAAEFVNRAIEQRPELKAALASQNMTPELFLQQLESTYEGQNEHGTDVQELAYVNKTNKKAVEAANDAAMSSWLNANITNATTNAAMAGLNYVMNAPAMPAAMVATGIHNLRHPEAKEGMGDLFDRQFGWSGAPRKIFGAGENAELNTGSKTLNFIGNVVTDPMAYTTGLFMPKGSATLIAGPNLYNSAARGIANEAPMLGEKIVTQTTKYIPKQTFKVTSKGNYPRGQQLTTSYGVPTYLGDMSKTIKYPVVIGGIPGVSFTPSAAGTPAKAVYTPTYLPDYEETIKYVKDWGDDCVQEAFREAAARGAQDGEIITGPCGKTYVYRKDPNFTGRVTAINPNQIQAGGTNSPIATEVVNNVLNIPSSVAEMRIPAGYSAVVTDDHRVGNTPTYNLGVKTFNYLDY